MSSQPVPPCQVFSNFTYFNPTKIVFGKDTIKTIGTHIAEAGCKKVLLVAGGGSIKTNGVYETVCASLRENHVQWVELWGVVPNPVVTKVREGVEICKKQGIDGILAVGGGSVLDSSKAICGGAAAEEDIWELYEQNAPVPTKLAPLFVVLTMSGTSSEFNTGAVLSNPATKKKIPCFFRFPVVSIIDPSVQQSLPWKQTRNGAIDTMSHILEQYIGMGQQDVTMSLCLALLGAVIRATDQIQECASRKEDDYTARCNLCWAASLGLGGLTCLGAQQDWNVHYMEHPMSALHPTFSHGEGLALATVPYMEWLYERFPPARPSIERFCREVMATANVADGLAKLKALFRKWGAPVTLREAGFSAAEVPVLADLYVSNGCESGILKLGKADVIEILTKAL